MKKMNSILLFFVKVWKPEDSELAKQEEEEVQEDVQRDLKVVKENMKML